MRHVVIQPSLIMAIKLTSLLLVTVFSYLIISCQSNLKHVEFLEINEEGIATFNISNVTDKDISSIGLELTYLNTANEVVKVDTVRYSMSEDSNAQVFLKAGEQTVISQKVPDNISIASGKIISTTN